VSIDATIVAASSQPVPSIYDVPGAQEIIVKSCYAQFDGTGAAGDFLPVVQFISPAGNIVATAQGPKVTAGGVADVSFFPHVAPPAAAPAAGASLYGAGLAFGAYLIPEGLDLTQTNWTELPSGVLPGAYIAVTETSYAAAGTAIRLDFSNGGTTSVKANLYLGYVQLIGTNNFVVVNGPQATVTAGNSTTLVWETAVYGDGALLDDLTTDAPTFANNGVYAITANVFVTTA
jgi:hypothetical protein